MRKASTSQKSEDWLFVILENHLCICYTEFKFWYQRRII